MAHIGIIIGMAPKTEGTPINVRIPADMLTDIDQRCAKTGNSRAETIRRMLRYALTAETKR